MRKNLQRGYIISIVVIIILMILLTVLWFLSNIGVGFDTTQLCIVSDKTNQVIASYSQLILVFIQVMVMITFADASRRILSELKQMSEMLNLKSMIFHMIFFLVFSASFTCYIVICIKLSLYFNDGDLFIDGEPNLEEGNEIDGLLWE